MLYHSALHRLLLGLDAERAHDVGIGLLSHCPAWACKTTTFPNAQAVELWGIRFPHRVGLAAGFDKNAACVRQLLAYGFSHVEVGTVTPRPQPGNPKPRMFRLKSQQALINRLGFNNKGVDHLLKQLQRQKPNGIVGINIGKNKNTPLHQAVDDYLYCQKHVHACADYITINISSPNTPDLRRLFESDYLSTLLQTLHDQQQRLDQHKQKKVPLLLKLSPDLAPDDLLRVIQQATAHHIDGVIASNTTIQRPDLEYDVLAKQKGGLSGQPLYPLSLDMVKKIQDFSDGNMIVIGCGGIGDPHSAQAFLNAGASLLQIYTGFIYQGPALIQAIVEQT